MAKAKRSGVPVPAEPESEIRNVDELDTALAELGRLESLRASLQAECDNKVATVTASFQDRMVVVVNDAQQPIAARVGELTRQITEYCEAHKAELLGDGDKKSVDLTHGTIGWKAKAKSIVAIEGKATLWEKCVTAAKALISAVLVRGKAVGSVPMESVMRVKIEFDKVSTMKLLDTAKISPLELRKIGFELSGGDDQFYVKPTALEVANHAAAEAA